MSVYFSSLYQGLAGWIAGVCPTSCSSLTTPGIPFIPRRRMSNSNSHVSSLISNQLFAAQPPYQRCTCLDPTCLLCRLVSEMEESMLSALRPPEHTSVPHNAPPRFATSSSTAHNRAPTDPSELPPDRLHVEMEMSPDSQIILYGPLLRALISIKVNP